MLSELWNLPKACNGPSGASGQEERASWQSDSPYWQPFLAGRWPGGQGACTGVKTRGTALTEIQRASDAT